MNEHVIAGWIFKCFENLPCDNFFCTFHVLFLLCNFWYEITWTNYS